MGLNMTNSRSALVLGMRNEVRSHRSDTQWRSDNRGMKWGEKVEEKPVAKASAFAEETGWAFVTRTKCKMQRRHTEKSN